MAAKRPNSDHFRHKRHLIGRFAAIICVFTHIFLVIVCIKRKRLRDYSQSLWPVPCFKGCTFSRTSKRGCMTYMLLNYGMEPLKSPDFVAQPGLLT